MKNYLQCHYNLLLTFDLDNANVLALVLGRGMEAGRKFWVQGTRPQCLYMRS
jgi:hypothetical protein